VKLEKDGPRLLRPGGITVEDLESTFGRVKIAPGNHGAEGQVVESRLPLTPESPGQFPKHYSPTKKLRFIDEFPHDERAGAGLISMTPLSTHEADEWRHTWSLSQTGDLFEVAKNLFRVLREADQSDASALAIDRCQKEGIGAAIMDRLGRATNK
ncbi:MAG: Sua5 family C-terminal domain-containing protein, partial [Planctomycetota bacterium]